METLAAGLACAPSLSTPALSDIDVNLAPELVAS